MMYILLIITYTLLTAYITLSVVLRKGLSRAVHANNLRRIDSQLSVSIIAAVRNEEDNIQGLLNALSSQDYSDYEVIIVDDDSDDNTRSIAENFCADKKKISVIPAAENLFGWGPKKNAIYHGIMRSKSDIIMTTDADCRPPAKWISNMVSYFDKGTGAVVGYSPLKFPASLAGRLKSVEALAAAIVSAGFISLGKPFISTGRNFAYRKKLFLKIGGFGSSGKAPAGDDDLLLQNIAKHAEVKFAFEPESFVPSYPGKGGYFARKKRHFSAAKRYPAMFILAGIMVYLLLSGICALLFLGILSSISSFIIAGITAIVFKFAADYALLRKGSKILHERFKITDMILAELLQFPYTLILQPISLAGKIEWRGRKL